jgi:hypothetical protein
MHGWMYKCSRLVVMRKRATDAASRAVGLMMMMLSGRADGRAEVVSRIKTARAKKERLLLYSLAHSVTQSLSRSVGSSSAPHIDHRSKLESTATTL